MYKITNKKTEVPRFEAKGKAPRDTVYADWILDSLKSHNGEGLTLGAMNERFKLIDKVEAMVKEKKNVLSFENSDFEIIKNSVASAKWLVIDRELSEFGSYISELKPDVEKKK